MSSTASLLLEVKATLGPMLVGTMLGSVFLGITFLQTILYYKTYRKDTRFLKSLVGSLCLLDTFSLVMWMHATYWFLIPHFGDYDAVATVIWSEAVEPSITGTIAFIVHLFLIWRIQILNRKWRQFCIVLLVASFITLSASVSASVIITVGIVKDESVGVVNSMLQWCGVVGDTFAVLVDLGIAASITYLLHRSRGFDRTNRLVNAVTTYIVSNGVITTIFRLVELALAVKYPDYLYVLVPYIPTSKAYTNALLATLNSRVDRRPQLSSHSATDMEWRYDTTEHSSESINMSRHGQGSSDCITKDPPKADLAGVNRTASDAKVVVAKVDEFNVDTKSRLTNVDAAS